VLDAVPVASHDAENGREDGGTPQSDLMLEDLAFEQGSTFDAGVAEGLSADPSICREFAETGI
jgi:hypothetical protein